MNPSDLFARQEDRQARESSYTRRTWGLDVPDMTIGEARSRKSGNGVWRLCTTCGEEFNSHGHAKCNRCRRNTRRGA